MHRSLKGTLGWVCPFLYTQCVIVHAPELYESIMSFDIDGDDPEFTFARRLARENGWTLVFAERVIDEYKRFVYLCMVSGHPCTPSEHVDQAWHLHLTYTRSYWERMCGEVLPRPLHHNPTRGGQSEGRKFDDWYARTKASYAALIGDAPPEDIWTPHKERFGHDLSWSRVNHADYYVTPKRLVRRVGVAMLALGAVLFVAAAPIGGQQTPSSLSAGTASMILLGVGVVGVIIGVLVALRTTRGNPPLERGFAVISGLTLGLSLPTLLICFLDRVQIVHFGIPQRVNNPVTIADLVLVCIGLFCFFAIPHLHSTSRGSGGCAGCGTSGGGIGGCGGCGGCGGGGCGGCGT